MGNNLKYLLKMVTNVMLLLCGQTLLAQCIFSQCIGTRYGNDDSIAFADSQWNIPYFTEAPITASWVPESCPTTPFVKAEWAPFALTASNGGSFATTSSSPIDVTGLFMTSENAYEGPVSVSGAIPFLGAVALEGALPTAGSGVVTYDCGNGNIMILSEDTNTYVGPYGYAPLGYDTGIPGYGYYNSGYGCGAF